jgi:hypothetical protein
MLPRRRRAPCTVTCGRSLLPRPPRRSHACRLGAFLAPRSRKGSEPPLSLSLARLTRLPSLLTPSSHQQSCVSRPQRTPVPPASAAIAHPRVRMRHTQTLRACGPAAGRGRRVRDAGAGGRWAAHMRGVAAAMRWRVCTSSICSIRRHRRIESGCRGKPGSVSRGAAANASAAHQTRRSPLCSCSAASAASPT